MSTIVKYPDGQYGNYVSIRDESGNPLSGLGGGAAQLQIRNSGDSAWINVVANAAAGSAVPVNVVGGGAGGGVAQLQTRNAGDTAWQNVIQASATNNVPVGITGPLVSGRVDINIGATGTAVPITDNSGSLTVDAPVATPVFVRLSDGTNPIATLPVSGTFWQATQPVSGTFWQTTQPVSGTFWQATQPVSIAATVTVDSELPAAAALANATANPTVPAVGSFNMVFNGATWDRWTGAVTGTVTANQGTPTNWAINNVQIGGNAISVGVGTSGTGTQRVVIANDNGKTVVSAGGSASTSGNNTLVAAGANRLKVKAFSLSTTSATAVTCIFQSGASGTELWRVILQAPTGVSTGANLSTPAPDWLFATATATLLNLNLSAAVAVNWSVSYFDEA